MLQVSKMRNVSAPKAFEESGGAPRMLRVTLTDGFGTVQGLEVQNIKTLRYMVVYDHGMSGSGFLRGLVITIADRVLITTLFSFPLVYFFISFILS